MLTMIDMQEIIPGPNDRHVFNEADLGALASSIAHNGLIQPITVRWLDDAGCYQIVAGERRYRACKLLGHTEIAAFVKELTDAEAAAIMLTENVGRQDLDPVDEGMAYAYRIETFGLTIEQVAREAGVTPIRVRFRMKLTTLRPELQNLVRTGNLPIGYAQTIADANLDPNRQMLALRKLRDNPTPTPPWFRKVVNEILTQQAQGELLDTAPLFGGETTVAMPAAQPPHPTTTTAPAKGHTPRERVQNQVSFWEAAAAAWDAIGKPFKRQECEAAAAALQSVLFVL